MKHILKPLFSVALLALTIGFANVSSAFADEVTVNGNTTGSFNMGPTGSTATSSGLVFTGGTFTVTTVDGFTAIGNVNVADDSLGTFTLSNAAHTFTGESFRLFVNFTAPTGIAGSTTATYTAALTGTVSSDGLGGVFFDFNNTPQTFSFANGGTTGTFTLSVNDVSVNAGGVVALSGNVTGSQTNPIPEPATMILLGSGLAGVVAKVRRRRREVESAE